MNVKLHFKESVVSEGDEILTVNENEPMLVEKVYETKEKSFLRLKTKDGRSVHMEKSELEDCIIAVIKSSNLIDRFVYWVASLFKKKK